jgi:hypothetical protein
MRRNKSCLSVSPLEGREVPACIVSYPNPETMVVTGNAANDVVILRDNGFGVVSGWATGAGFFGHAGIKNIQVFTGDGADRVYYHLQGHLQPGQQRAVTAWLGNGNDYFLANLHNPAGVASDLRAGSNLSIAAHGGDGSDHLVANALGGVDVASGAKLAVNLDGGNSNDLIRAYYAGENDGTVAFNLDGGFGNDRIHGYVYARLGSTGVISAKEDGGFGNDYMTLAVYKPATAALALAEIDGGPGTDIGLGTTNVTKVNLP